MVAVKSLWVLLKSFSTNFSFKRDNGVKVPDHKPDKRIRYNRLRPQWHKPYYPPEDTEVGNGGMASGSSNFVTSSKSYQDYLNGNCGDDGENKFKGQGSGGSSGANYHNKDFENFINSDSDYEDGDSDAEDFDDDFTTTDEDSDLDDDDDGEEVLACDVCDRTFPTIKKLDDHQQKKRHYGCLQCDSMFPSRKALEFHREQMDHFEFVSDYGTDDTTSFGSGTVNPCAHNGVASGSAGAKGDENKYSSNTPGNSQQCIGIRKNNNNNFCYGNQLHSSWYEGDDEEEKGLLRN